MSATGDVSLGRIFAGCPLPDVERITMYRRSISTLVNTTDVFVRPDLRGQLLAVIEKLSVVDADVLRLTAGIEASLSAIDVTPYREGIATLDKPERTQQENVAFLYLQEEMAHQLYENAAAAKAYLAALDASLEALETSLIDDAQLSGSSDIQHVIRFKTGYVHETAKLAFAVRYFFDNVLEASPHVIERADDFVRHCQTLVSYLRTLRQCWSH